MGMHRNGSKILWLRFSRPGQQPDVPEAEEGELRMPGLLPVPADILCSGLGAAVVFVIPVAVLILHLGMIKQHFIARMSVQRDFHIAGDLLAEVHHGIALWRFENAFRGDALRFPNLFALLGDQDLLAPFQQLDRLPIRGLDAGVAGFAVIDFAEQHPAVRPLPAFVCGNSFFRAVGITNMQGSDHPAGLTHPPLLVLAVQPARHGRAEPTPAYGDAQIVFPLQKRRHVIGLHLESVIIAGPAGSQHIAAHPLTVDSGFINA